MIGKALTSSSEDIVKPCNTNGKNVSLGVKEEEKEQEECRRIGIKGSKTIVGALERRIKYI